MESLTLLFLSSGAFLLNFPFGILRIKTRKFSLVWFLCIHLPVIPIIFIRKLTGLNYTVIPYTLGLSLLGQFLGAKTGRWWFSS
jgi:hypothetical protein